MHIFQRFLCEKKHASHHVLDAFKQCNQVFFSACFSVALSEYIKGH